MSKPVKMPTDRSFGVTFAVIFALVAAWLYWRGHRYALPALGVAGAFALVAATVPRILHPLNVVWMKFGFLLGMIVSPIVLGVIYLLLFVPVGLFFRMTGRDALKRKFDSGLNTYWIDRTPPGPDGKSFPRQF
jgi:predicted membrane metal-binding protein